MQPHKPEVFVVCLVVVRYLVYNQEIQESSGSHQADMIVISHTGNCHESVIFVIYFAAYGTESLFSLV